MSVPFQTTPEQVLRLEDIVSEMRKAGVDTSLICAASELARTDQGVFDLLELWMSEIDNPVERVFILVDVKMTIDDYRKEVKP